MVHFCVFGGQEGQLSPGKSIYVSIFGAATLKRPPLASRAAQLGERSERDRGRPRHFFLTIFGSTTVKWPTLAEEFLALLDALRSERCTLEAWDHTTARLGNEAPLQAASFTLFGGFDTDELPSEDEELDALTLQRHLGYVQEPAVERLMLAIGQGGAQRLAAVRQAVAATLSNSP